jgi:cell division protein FtsQ
MVGFIEAETKKTTCKSFEVSIDYEGADPLISAELVKMAIYRSFDTLIGRKLSDLNLVAIENMVNDIEFVANADVYTTLTGKMNVRVTQRKPILRIINTDNHSFYIDQNGEILPTNTGFPSRVLIASGTFGLKYADTLNTGNSDVLKDLYNLASYIHNDPLLNIQIEQIYVKRYREYELIPKVGRHVIVFGNIENMEEKFRKLVAFYHQGINNAGWNTYKTINLKFDNQVVCSKK